MTDVVFYLKAAPTAAERALPWPEDTKLVALDPVALGLGCGGGDAYCSTAYSQLYYAFKGVGGVMPQILAHYAKDIDVERVAFVGFSAAHGFLNPLLADDRDRSRVSAIVLLDACFGGGKTGYQEALRDAAAGDMLYATTTSNSGSAWKLNTDLTSGTLCFENNVLAPTGLEAVPVDVRPPMPPPSGGAWRIGKSGFWLRYADDAGATELHHYDMGKVQTKMIEAYLVPYWSGALEGGVPGWLGWAALAAAAVGAGWYFGRRAA